MPSSDSQSIGGMIGYLGLEDFWLSLSPQQQQFIIHHVNDHPTEGKVTRTLFTPTPMKYLCSLLGYAAAEHDYDLADKIARYCDFIEPESKPLDRHFFYLAAQKCYYAQRETRFDAITLTEKYCLLDIILFPKYRKPLLKLVSKDNEILPMIPSFQQLAILYEKTGRIEEAIEICNLALKYGIEDTSKMGFKGRIEKLTKKLSSKKESKGSFFILSRTPHCR